MQADLKKQSRCVGEHTTPGVQQACVGLSSFNGSTLCVFTNVHRSPTLTIPPKKQPPHNVKKIPRMKTTWNPKPDPETAAGNYRNKAAYAQHSA